jgi:serine/threonine-protein kinase PknK
VTGETVPGYSVLEVVGRGGSGVVYRARQDDLDRVVALKVLDRDLGGQGEVRRFRRECRLLVRLGSHPNVVTVLDSGTTRAGRPFIAMEYYERGSLHDRLLAGGPLPVAEVLRMGEKIADALAAAHGEGVLHRDVKPQNVLVSRFDEPALADFGVAAAAGAAGAADVSAGSDQLTPHHVAPEVLEGGPPSAAADVYGLGSTLYTLLAGHAPHQRPEDAGVAPVLLRVLHDDPPEIARPDLPPAVDAAVRTAMARRPEDRFTDARALAGRLRELRSQLEPDAETTVHRSVLPDMAASPPRAPAAAKRPWWANRYALAGAALAACLAIALVQLARPAPAPPPRRPPSPRASAPAPTPTAAPAGTLLAAARPAGLSATDGGATVVLRWTLAAGSTYPIVVQRSSPGGGAPVLTALPGGATSATVAGLDPAAGYCFQVGAVVAFGQPTTVAWSAPVCVRGAVAWP